MDGYQNEHYDMLTGIPNRAYFFLLVKEHRDKAPEKDGSFVIGFTDFNGMKFYNKKHGFAAGDRVLKGFAGILSGHFGESNICRISQDNFAFFTEASSLEKELDAIFEEFSELSGDKSFSVRIGIYSDSMGVVEPGLSCDRARKACNSIKALNKSGFKYFDEEMLAYENNYQYILYNLDRALDEHWIKAFYQPIIRAASGMVCDEEALARWIDPERGMLSPADFIPILEDSKQIYRVDLYIVDRIIERIKAQVRAGLYVVPVSVNLSRTDFDQCDIVDEIVSRLDAAGIDHSKLTIEITESVIGSDIGFMKEQVERFQSLGFQVWMDDFGSGYSSLDLLQTMSFDLIKLDMRFMKQFDNSDRSRIIITELIKMAVGLGIDTVTEGVEREDQVEFLRDVGCTKLQGYHFCKPVPFEEILKRYEEGRQIGFENPMEAGYFESLGRINLYDMSSVGSDATEKFGRYFDTMPMAIIESDEYRFKVVRCNRAYKEFLERASYKGGVGVSLSYDDIDLDADNGFIKALKKCSKTGEKVFIDEKIGHESRVHSFVRRVAVNPVTGFSACVVVVMGIVKETEQGITYADVANSLSADYIDLYHVNLETEDYVEYLPGMGGDELAVGKRGTDFFETSRKDALQFLYKDDSERFVSAFTKENIINSINSYGSFTMTYRLMLNEEPVYVNMKALRMSTDDRFIIVGVNNVDAQMRQQEALERMKEEQITYARISALAGDYIAIYTVDPETDRFVQYGAKSGYEKLGLDKIGYDFFSKSRKEVVDLIVPEDYEMFDKAFSKENILTDIKEHGEYTLDYHLMINGSPLFVRLKAAMVQEKDGPQLIVGVRNISLKKRREEP